MLALSLKFKALIPVMDMRLLLNKVKRICNINYHANVLNKTKNT